MNTKLFITAILCLLIILSCQHAPKETQALDTMLAPIQKDEASSQKSEEESKQKIPIGIPTQNPTNTDDSSIVVKPLPTSAHIDWNKKIIKTASIKLEVKNFKKYNESIHQNINRFGGYIAQEEQNLQDEKTETQLSLKVPVDQFEALVNELTSNDVKIVERSIKSEDVTGEVVDTKSRLEAKRTARLKYLEFLKASKNMEEVLTVQSEINNIQEEIEAAAGRVAYLSNQAAYSTINLVFYQPLPGFKPVDSSPSFFTRMTDAFKSGTTWISDCLVALVSVWPLILIIATGLFMYKRFRILKTTPAKL
ncbi:hypothetical protein BH11BAC3_BH11BAC3_33860 [soil metagenome]